MDKPHRELHLFFAAENSTAVILYRASSSLHRLISWDTNGDKIVPGQWVKTRVYGFDCALSPDGEYFIYSAMQKGTPHLFSAVSRPPYFTALEFFPELTAYDTGGYFLDKRVVTFKHIVDDRDEILLESGLVLNRQFQNWAHAYRPRGIGLTGYEREELARTIEVKRGKIPELLQQYECEGGKLFRKTAGGLELLLDCTLMEFEAIQAPFSGCARMSNF
ncbi:hypothetical protein [Leisingera sp. NJS204]|uniref:hypothetical protein n=1 Tax=Leisingera sp. NJS204 TaxID=2508307 RepID=UPI001012ADFA|nr:hypothetical protein [Leisingera sp. NJS204]QAX28558.1 hypothetical protein ETW24_03730 [Leisingera sp. NJS204]